MKVAISGFGRIGKNFLRAAVSTGAMGRDFDVVAINTRSSMDMHLHLFKYDSTFGRFHGEAVKRNNNFCVNGYEIKWIQEADPLKLPWKELGIDLVLESSGEFTSRADAEKHISAGAKKVLVSAPGEECDATIVLGVNDHTYNKDMKVVSMASCTTNCLAPVIKVMHQKFGVQKGFLSTIHAYTNDQRMLDGSHKDWRRARAGAVSIIPTKTGAAKAIGLVLPELKGKLDGLAFRVPVPDGSMNDMTLILDKETDAKEVNKELERASREELKGIVGYTEEPLVSHDIVGTTESAIVDAGLTKAMGNMVKISAWYDNEYGYSCRLVDFCRKVAKG